MIQFNATHDKATFNNHSDPLNCNFKEQASRDIKPRISACLLAISQDNYIIAYYTLALASALLSYLPESLLKKLLRYATIPAVQMGRLASAQYKGQGIGTVLMEMHC